jgi:natural product precursor
MKCKSLKLNVLASENLSKVELNQVKGGNSCSCGCQGPSSTGDNCNANYNDNLKATAPVKCTKKDYIDPGK